MNEVSSEMAKNAGSLLLEEVFKEPTKIKEKVKEELKSEDFSLILTQWKASSRKTATTGIGSARYQALAKDHLLGKTSIVSGRESGASGIGHSTALPATTAGFSTAEQNNISAAGGPVDEKGKKATLFWSAMRNKGTPAAALKYSLAAKKSTAGSGAGSPAAGLNPFPKSPDSTPTGTEQKTEASEKYK